MEWQLTRKAYDKYVLDLFPVGEQPIHLGDFDGYPAFAEITRAIEDYQQQAALDKLDGAR